MHIEHFLGRDKEYMRITTALHRQSPQFIVVYGRRRIGKSTLLKHVLRQCGKSVYFLADRTNEANQRWLFSNAASAVIPGFANAIYPDWEALFRALNRQINQRIVVCLDEFPYLVKNCSALPSILQKLLNERTLRFDLIICGSAQQQMHDIVLDKKEPLYGLADEIMLIQQIPAKFITAALGCTAEEAVNEYAVWGGVPRYWEIRKNYPSMMDAITAQMLDPNGFLMEEPSRLLRDDMRDSVQTETLLSIIGNGANKISEIAARAGKEASKLTEPLARLRELGYVEREIPFGEEEKKSKRGIYHVSDSLFRFLYKFVIPYRSILQLDCTETVVRIINDNMSQYVAECWERMCCDYVSGNIIDDIPYDKAGRWWGKIFPENNKDGQMVELDVVAESIDKKHIIIGECKWTSSEDAHRLIARLENIRPWLPFIKPGQQVHFMLFLKNKPVSADLQNGNILFPKDILS